MHGRERGGLGGCDCVKVRVRCLCMGKWTLRIILKFKLVSVNCVSMYMLQPPEKPTLHHYSLYMHCRWMGPSCMGAGDVWRLSAGWRGVCVDDQPANISTKSEPTMEMKGTLASPATALASKVLPVPGGPYRRAP